MKHFSILLLSCIVYLNSLAQTTSASFDPEFAVTLQATLDNFVLTNSIQGASCAAYIPGQGTWIGVSGESYRESLLHPTCVFNIASQSKGMIAVTLLKLQEEGLVSLDDYLDDWLPSYTYVDSSITIRQLLTHQSGGVIIINRF